MSLTVNGKIWPHLRKVEIKKVLKFKKAICNGYEKFIFTYFVPKILKKLFSSYMNDL